MPVMTGSRYATVSADGADACPPTVSVTASDAPTPATLSHTTCACATVTWQFTAVYSGTDVFTTAYVTAMPTVPSGPRLAPFTTMACRPRVSSAAVPFSDSTTGVAYRRLVPLNGADTPSCDRPTATRNTSLPPMPGAAAQRSARCGTTMVHAGDVYSVPVGPYVTDSAPPAGPKLVPFTHIHAPPSVGSTLPALAASTRSTTLMAGGR